MNSLLKFATEAHGGLDRWNQLRSLTASVSVTGDLWQIKGKPDVLKDIRVELALHLERLVTHFIGQRRRFAFTRSRVAVEDERGKTLDSRNDPRTAFDGQLIERPWGNLQIAYFNRYASWTYLTILFLHAHPAFTTEELPHWHENGEEWRPPKAIFPSTIASHCHQQVSYFGPDGMVRRHKCVVDVMGGVGGLNYPYDYRELTESRPRQRSELWALTRTSVRSLTRSRRDRYPGTCFSVVAHRVICRGLAVTTRELPASGISLRLSVRRHRGCVVRGRSVLATMTLKIERIAAERATVIRLIGTLRREHLDIVSKQTQSCAGEVTIDLGDLALISVEGVRFLNACEDQGIAFTNAPSYVTVWMKRARMQTGDDLC